MAHGKETPRQKMIGMMYLVLTALLALNVAAEVLNAFKLMDESLRKSTENTVIKNGDIYSKFEAANKENPTRTGPWKKKADQIGVKATELVDYIQELKVKIVQTLEGPQGDPNHLEKKDDLNVPGQIMIQEKNAETLKQRIDEYRDFLIGMVEGNEGLVNGLKSNLSTDEVEGKEEGSLVKWEVAHFDNMPSAGVMALMSKMQADVRTAEANMLDYLFTKIDEGSFKFNKIEAIVTAPSNYVLMGQPFKAQVFIAASDSTVNPVIKLTGGSELPVENGKGLYTGSTGSPGPKSFGGVIEMKNPKTKELMTFPFKSEYTVGQASLVVSATKMNVLFVGVDNPVDVSVPGVPPSKVRASLSGGGSLVRRGNGYIARVKGPVGKTVRIGASAELDGQNKSMGSKEFRVKKVPDPVAKVGGMRGGTISRNKLAAQTGVSAVLENFYFDLRFSIVSFNVSAVLKGGYVEDAKSSSARFTARQQQIIRKVPSKGKVYIENIKARGPDGTTRDLGSIAFKVR